MPKAFVLIETEVGKVNEVVATLKGMEGVKTANGVTGPYDVIAVVEGGLIKIVNIETRKIKVVPGVRRMVTCLVVA